MAPPLIRLTATAPPPGDRRRPGHVTGHVTPASPQAGPARLSAADQGDGVMEMPILGGVVEMLNGKGEIYTVL